MLASELISKLQELQKEFGDLEVKVDAPLCNEQQDIDYLCVDHNMQKTKHWFSISH